MSARALVLPLALLAFACSGKDKGDELIGAATSGTGAGAAGGTVHKPKADTRFQTPADEFVFAISGEPETLDPGRMRGVNEGKVGDTLFEGLLEYPLGTSTKMAPGVAETFEVSADGLTYTFKLRRNAKWSNGDALTAEDFRFSWLRVLDKKLGAPYADMLFPIKGAKEFLEGKRTDPKSVGIEVLDPYTLRVTLKYVAPYFPELCAFHTYRPVHKATVQKHGDRWTRPETIVSNGAFELKAWRPGKHLKLVKSKTYWDAGQVALSKVTILPIQENTTVLNYYESGKLDWTGSTNLPAIRMATLQRRPDYHEDPYAGVYFYRFNVTHEVMKNLTVRKAMTAAVDRKAIVKVLKGGFVAAKSQVPPMPGYTSATNGVDFDPTEAAKLMAQAGFPKGAGFPQVSLLYNTDENHKQVAEMIQQMWQTHLGIKVELINQEWKVYLKSQTNLNYIISRSGWIGDFLDPVTFLGMWQTGNGNNHTGWSDAEFDGLIKRARTEGDPQKRMGILTQAETLLLQRGPVLPIYHYTRPFLLNPAVQGFKAHVLDQHPLKYIKKRG